MEKFVAGVVAGVGFASLLAAVSPPPQSRTGPTRKTRKDAPSTTLTTQEPKNTVVAARPSEKSTRIEAAAAPPRAVDPACDPRAAPYLKMLKMGIPRGAVVQKMNKDGIPESVLDGGGGANVEENDDVVLEGSSFWSTRRLPVYAAQVESFCAAQKKRTNQRSGGECSKKILMDSSNLNNTPTTKKQKKQLFSDRRLQNVAIALSRLRVSIEDVRKMVLNKTLLDGISNEQTILLLRALPTSEELSELNKCPERLPTTPKIFEALRSVDDMDGRVAELEFLANLTEERARLSLKISACTSQARFLLTSTTLQTILALMTDLNNHDLPESARRIGTRVTKVSVTRKVTKFLFSQLSEAQKSELETCIDSRALNLHRQVSAHVKACEKYNTDATLIANSFHTLLNAQRSLLEFYGEPDVSVDDFLGGVSQLFSKLKLLLASS